jgi:hypothetical protein
MGMKGVLSWLLEPSEPSVRYLAMRDLLDGTSESDLELARKAIGTRGWAADILSKQKPGGYWEAKEDLYRPKYLSTNWMLITLSDLGLTKKDPRVAKGCKLWMDRFARPDGGFDMGGKHSEHCLTGNTARALVKFGYSNEPRVKSAFENLVETQKKNGGWHCWGSSGTLDAWEGLSAFAVYPRQKWTKSMKAAVERGCEFYLKKELSKQGAYYAPWFRFHFPYHYYYDLLVGLDFMTALGYGDDPRMGLAVKHLKKKRRKDGRWNLDAVQPDMDNEGKWPRWWPQYKDRYHPFALEEVGQPSKIITLRALTVLKRLGEFDGKQA